MRLLKSTCVGDDVKKWQSFLFGQGFREVEVDGKFGHDTTVATKAFQLKNKLAADGKVGNQTYAAALRLGLAIVENHGSYPPRPAFRSPDAEARERMLGKFGYARNSDGTIRILDGWAAKNIVKVHIPQLAGIENAPKDCTILFHKNGVNQLQALFAAWEAAGLLKYIKTWAGTFSPRMVRGSKTNLSNHAYASAFDINAAWNGLGVNPPLTHQTGTVVPLVAIANAHGFFWGGHYQNRKDGMHFELAVRDMFPPSAESFQSTIQEIERVEHIRLEVPNSSAAAPADNPPEDDPSNADDAPPFDSPAVVPNPIVNQPPPDNSTPQIAENIQNNVESRADEQAIAIAQNTAPVEVEKTEPTGFLVKLWKTIVGIFTGTIILPAFLQNGLDYNAALALVLNLVRENFKYILFGAIIGLSVWYVTKKYNNFALTKLLVETNTDVGKKDVRLVDFGAPKSFPQKIF